MTRDRLYLFDTTLRDGAQTTGVDFSLEDKRAVATLLDRLGLDYVEGGYPGANPLDTSFFAEKRTKNAKFTAFGMTKRAGRSAANDPGIAALLDADADAICFVAKASGLPRPRRARDDAARRTSTASATSVAAALARGREVHRRLRAFLRRLQGQSRPTRSPAPRAAHEAGARWVVLCDTNGGTLPHEVERIVRDVTRCHPGRQARHPRP